MKPEIEINEGDDLTLLRLWREHCAVFRERAPDAKVRQMAARIHQALEHVQSAPGGGEMKPCRPEASFRSTSLRSESLKLVAISNTLAAG